MHKSIGRFQSHNKMFSHKTKIFFSFFIALVFLFPTITTAAITDIVGGGAACGAGQVLGRIIGSTVGKAIGGITGNIKRSIASAVSSANEVPIKNPNLPDIKSNTDAAAFNTGQVTSAQVGGGQYGTGFSGIAGGISTPSWNSIMFCIVNEMITYITQSTIQWINSGFKGNPVFIQNIGAVFQQIANREKSQFMYEVKTGFRNGQGIAINGVQSTAYQIAQPFRNTVYKTISGYGNNNYYGNIPQMSPQLTQNWNSFAGGNWYAGGGSMGLVQASQSNPYAYQLATQRAIAEKVAYAQQIQQSQIDQGIRSFYKCRPGATLYQDGSCPPGDQIITTPAKAINDETASVQSMKYMRLAFAQNFDSIVSALVNQLVKIAINKTYEAVQK